jgi:hypothetical protein
MTQWGLDTLFNPAKRHMDEEKLRQQSTREEVGDSSGGKRIDLESGRVTINTATSDGDEEPSAEGTSESATEQDAGTAEGTAETPAAKAETPAQARARARRAKMAKG